MSYPGNWSWPKHPRGYGHWQINRYRLADPSWTAGVNRIMGHPIGVYVTLGRWCYGICRPIDPETRRQRQAKRLRARKEAQR